jgi:UDP-N-acetylglucosamine 2-epimerase (non-hydrolysing)
MTVRKRIAIVLGTRPEVIKLASCIHELRAADWAQVDVLLTGQHGAMLRPLLEHFGIDPVVELPVRRVRGTLAELISLLASAMDQYCFENRPDAIIVQGDTTSAMAAAICGYSDRYRVVHVEAGLRSFDLEQPFPEEFNRRVISIAAALHLAPSEESRAHLLKEGIPEDRCHVVGNTVIDALLWTIGGDQGGASPFREGTFRILATCHRRESWDGGVEAVCEGLLGLADQIPNAQILFPVHPNPTVADVVNRMLGGHPKVTLVAPLGYREFCFAMSAADLIVSDSGGVQEEALALGKPTLVTRWKTERPEVLQWNTVRLVGPDAGAIMREGTRLFHDQDYYQACAKAYFPFGHGDSGRRIATFLREALLAEEISQ